MNKAITTLSEKLFKKITKEELIYPAVDGIIGMFGLSGGASFDQYSKNVLLKLTQITANTEDLQKRLSEISNDLIIIHSEIHQIKLGINDVNLQAVLGKYSSSANFLEVEYKSYAIAMGKVGSNIEDESKQALRLLYDLFSNTSTRNIALEFKNIVTCICGDTLKQDGMIELLHPSCTQALIDWAKNDHNLVVNEVIDHRGSRTGLWKKHSLILRNADSVVNRAIDEQIIPYFRKLLGSLLQGLQLLTAAWTDTILEPSLDEYVNDILRCIDIMKKFHGEVNLDTIASEVLMTLTDAGIKGCSLEEKWISGDVQSSVKHGVNAYQNTHDPKYNPTSESYPFKGRWITWDSEYRGEYLIADQSQEIYGGRRLLKLPLNYENASVANDIFLKEENNSTLKIGLVVYYRPRIAETPQWRELHRSAGAFCAYKGLDEIKIQRPQNSKTTSHEIVEFFSELPVNRWELDELARAMNDTRPISLKLILSVPPNIWYNANSLATITENGTTKYAVAAYQHPNADDEQKLAPEYQSSQCKVYIYNFPHNDSPVEIIRFKKGTDYYNLEFLSENTILGHRYLSGISSIVKLTKNDGRWAAELLVDNIKSYLLSQSKEYIVVVGKDDTIKKYRLSDMQIVSSGAYDQLVLDIFKSKKAEPDYLRRDCLYMLYPDGNRLLIDTLNMSYGKILVNLETGEVQKMQFPDLFLTRPMTNIPGTKLAVSLYKTLKFINVETKKEYISQRLKDPYGYFESHQVVASEKENLMIIYSWCSSSPVHLYDTSAAANLYDKSETNINIPFVRAIPGGSVIMQAKFSNKGNQIIIMSQDNLQVYKIEESR